MKTITRQELTKILELHEKWLNNEEGGVRADLREADLSEADLRRAYLREADLREAYLRGADLLGADLREADLRGADLRGAYLRRADLREADLRGTKLTNIKINANTTGLTNLCPEGSFIAWKKLEGDVIAKLLIPEHAHRSNATTLKCRASEVKVLLILKKENDTWVEIEKGVSKHDSDFIYEVEKTVKVDDFDEDRWNECSTGIHFFIDRQVAEQY